jgi:hypothetical protein
MSVEEKPWGKLITDDATGQTVPIIRDRALYVADEDFSLDPGSLVGSWFLCIVERQTLWLGVIVAEPQAGRYLCHLGKLEEGAKDVQRLFPLDVLMGLGDEMRRPLDSSYGQSSAPVIDPTMEFRFYDNEAAATKAYVEWETRVHVET